MDVVAHLGGLVGRGQLHGGVGDGELGVHAHHSGNHVRVVGQGVFDPGRVLHHSFLRLVHPVAVRNLITQTGADSQFLSRVLDGEQAVVNLAEAGVVVEHRGDAVLDGVNIGSPGALAGLLVGQVAVDGPPHSVQNLQKAVGVVSINRKSSRHGAVDVLMGVDERRHDHAPPGVYVLCLREFPADVLRGSDPHDGSAVHCYRAVLIKRNRRIPCH